ncbi:MAG: beta-eliminating lyase-related protein, partial [Amylibacter sp.]
GALSLTNVTEVGTIYTLNEIRTLTSIAKDLGIATHLDGARFANAMVALDCTPAEMTWKSGIDAVSFGGTKNGCMGVEAVVLFDPDKAWEFELRRKRGGHLMSKYRYLSAQMEAYLTDDLWIKLAKHANAMGDLLAAGIKDVKGAKFHHPQQANMLFCGWPRSGHTLAQAAGSMYYAWPEAEHPEKGPSDEQLSARLVTSWSTTPQDVERFLDLIAG